MGIIEALARILPKYDNVCPSYLMLMYGMECGEHYYPTPQTHMQQLDKAGFGNPPATTAALVTPLGRLCRFGLNALDVQLRIMKTRLPSLLRATSHKLAKISGRKAGFLPDLPRNHQIHSNANVFGGVSISRELNCLGWKWKVAHPYTAWRRCCFPQA